MRWDTNSRRFLCIQKGSPRMDERGFAKFLVRG
jgi:hypothetical protein